MEVRQQERSQFQDWRFGIFVHWGLSAGLGDNHSLGEEDIGRRVSEFYQLTEGFNPTRWVEAFQQAGAKYFTVTNRHSADYRWCLFPTDRTKWHSKRDYIGEINAACQEKGLPLFFYYSMTDWDPKSRFDVTPYTVNDDWQPVFRQGQQNMGEWLAECARRYNPTGFWLDGWCGLKGRLFNNGFRPASVVDYHLLTEAVREINPNVLIGNKADLINLKDIGPYVDYHTTEYLFQTHFGEPLYGDEMCTEVNETLPGSVHWFCSYDQQYPGRYPAKKEFRPEERFLTEAEVKQQAKLFIKRLVSVVGRGANYLLNVGPLPTGEILSTDALILQEIGHWLRKNGEAIYGTRLGPYREINRSLYKKDGPEWGYNVVKGDKIYLHIIDNRDITEAYSLGNRGLHHQAAREAWERTGMPKDKRIVLDRKRYLTIQRAHLLHDPNPLPLLQEQGRVVIDLSRVDPDPLDTIVVLEQG